MVAANLRFVPWVRQGAAAGIATPDTLAPPLPARVTLEARLAINGVPSGPRPVRLFGPGDVLGLDPRQIVRMDPPPGSAGFEPNYFAAIEFDRPDFPWLFTPAAAAAEKLRPWLVLVVVKKQPGVLLLPAGDAPLPSLSVTAPARIADELPDLAEAALWAHAQAAGGEALATALGARPEQSLSRLLCPRLLQPLTDYSACVVPAFEAGRQAGLGLEVTAATLAPAWTPAQAQVTLPVYHQWNFRTGAGGDFESLVRLLEARSAPAGLGRRPVNIATPGFALDAAFPQDATLDFGGALQPMNSEPEAWPTDAQTPFQQALAPILNQPGVTQAASPDADPLLAPPIYGRWHAARTTVAPGAGADWLDELNLDPRYRGVAACGTRVVQEHQEALMAAAWAQAGELQRANQWLRQLQLSLVVGVSLHTRHLGRLSDDALLRVSAPAFARITLSGARDTAPHTVQAELRHSALPLQAASPPMRKLVAARGAIGRRLAVQGAAQPGGVRIVSMLGSGAGASFVAPALPDVITVNAVRQHMAQPNAVRVFQQVNAQTVAGAGGKPQFAFAAEGQAVPLPAFTVMMARPDNAAAAAFRAAAVRHLEAIDAGRMAIMVAMRPVQMQALRSGVREQTEPRAHIVALAHARVTSPAARAVARAGSLPVEPVMLAPRFRQPMYEPLRDLSQQLLLPGLEAVLPNSVIGLQTHRRFVEAYMVGLNVEMGSELLWRGYPTDQRGTCFDRFWDTRAAAPRPDIEPIHRWGTRRLGDADGAPQRERFVLLLRSELLRRYPSAVLYATKAVLDDAGFRAPSPDPADESYPAFRGSMEPDLSFFGFNLGVDEMLGSDTSQGCYIVIQEQPSEPRFGLDVGIAAGATSHLQLAAGAPAGHPLQGLQWGRNAAHMAGILRQMPVRIAIHASGLL
jgi:hypothetical protein